jgi:sugar phosphate permease
MSQTVATAPPPLAGFPTPLNATYRRITWRLLPFLMGLWILSWIDRVNIGFAKLQMLADLGFSETVYGIGAGIFFLGYFLCEVPSNLLFSVFDAKQHYHVPMLCTPGNCTTYRGS